MKYHLLPALLACSLIIGLLAAEHAAADLKSVQQNSCYSTAWPHENSDLEPDPSLHYGRLDNGFRYVLMSNQEPKDRVGVYLNVEAGSLHERDNERGLAHFLEHMLFNGTNNFPPGELIDFFQSIGMGFGADVNGYTTYTDTVYKLLLPSGDKESLDQGLLVMRDYADGALLLEEEIERERGVIMAEKAARDSAAYRSRLARIEFIFKGTPLPHRMPIGDADVLENAGRDELLGFYQRWYRPDNMILVAVGDFSLQEAEDLIRKHFDPMRTEAAGECPDYGTITFEENQAFYHYEPELGVTDVLIETIGSKVPEHDSVDVQQDQILSMLASRIVNQRLSKLREAVDTPFLSAGYYDSLMFDRFRITGIRAQTDKGSWRESLARIDEVLRQVLDYGFYEEEVSRAKKDLYADLKNRAAAAGTRSSQRLISQIIAHLDVNRVMQSPEQELALYGPFIEQISSADLNQLAAERWFNKPRIVQLTGDAALDTDQKQTELLAFYEEISGRSIEPPAQIEQVNFPYLEATGDATPSETITYEDIDVQRTEFADGLILNSKVTDFKKNEVQVALHFGDGLRSLPKNGLDQLASAVVNGSGTATLEKSELNAALSGTSVNYRFNIGPESFSLDGQSVSADIELLFQVLHSVLSDPGFRPSVYQVSMNNFEAMYQRLSQSIEGGAALFLPPFFTGDALGAGLPSRSDFMSLRLDEVISWLSPYFAEAPLELSVVGDFDPQQIMRLASKYFGGLKGRTYTPENAVQAEFPQGRLKNFEVASSIEKTLIRTGWLTDDFYDIKRTRRLNVLSAVLEDRLRRKLREDLGATYSPSAYSSPSRIYPGYGVLYANLTVERHLIDVALAAVQVIESSFLENPVSADELQRTKEPILTSLKDTVRRNAYWLHSVLTLSSRNEDQLIWPLQMIPDYHSIEVDEINEFARFYLTGERRATALVEGRAAADQFSSN